MITFTDLLKRTKTEKIAIHTPTEEQAITLLTELDKRGYKWESGMKLNSAICYEVEKENTCYNFGLDKAGCFSTLEFYQDRGYTIIEFTDIDFKENA